jgi:hypothetical protein
MQNSHFLPSFPPSFLPPSCLSRCGSVAQHRTEGPHEMATDTERGLERPRGAKPPGHRGRSNPRARPLLADPFGAAGSRANNTTHHPQMTRPHPVKGA